MTPPVFVRTDDLLSLHRSDSARATRVTASGELDSCTAPVLAAALEDALGEEGREVTLDLDAVFFLDAAGVHVLAAAAQRAAAMGARLQVIASRPAVIRPLTIAGLRSLLESGAVNPEARQAA
jgi:anti-sigma B factor antagonist